MKVKKIYISLIFLISILFISSICFASEKGIATGNRIRVREENNTSAKILFYLSKDNMIEILDEKDNWYQIQYKDQIGWVSADFISTDNITYTLKTTKDTEVLMLPTINAKSITTISSNNSLNVHEEINGWCFIEKDEIKGWVREEVLEQEVKVEEEPEEEEIEEQPEEEEKPEEEKETNVTEEETEKTEEATILRYVYIDTNSARIRKEANTSSSIIDTATEGTKIAIIGEEGDWYKIQIVGKTGYIRKDLTRETKESTVSRSDSGRDNSAQEQVNQEDNTVAEAPVQTPTDNTTQTEEVVTEKPNTQEQTNTNSGVSGSDIVAYAKQYVGRPYVYGGASPSGFDCSGLVYYTYKNCAGITLSRSSAAQAGQGTKISKGELQPGDLVFFSQDGSGKNVGHVGIYIGGNQMVHASTPSTGVIITSLSESYYVKNYVCSRRILGN